jgi:sigma-B regulation protein RsbU (phosphoserine phosphatase)
VGKSIDELIKELKQSKFRFGSIYEFSDSLYSSFDLDHIFRVFFSTLMGQLGITKLFFFDLKNDIFRKRGIRIDDIEKESIKNNLKKIEDIFFVRVIDELQKECNELKDSFEKKKLFYIIDLSLSKKREIYLALGRKFNRLELSKEEIEYAFFLSKFTITALDNAFMVNKIVESKQVERELKIAKDIQLSLLPQSLPALKNFEISVIYKPLSEVGGDYYDTLTNNNKTTIIVADVEGKGLSAALLGASSQAVLHSMNEFYSEKPAKFIAKANSLIYDFTKGKRFITLFWMILDDENKTVSYVNAGHIEPVLISNGKVKKLSKGGFLTGFLKSADYEDETISLQSNDLITIFTDGVVEVESPEGEEYGEERLYEFLKQNSLFSSQKIKESFIEEIDDFSKGTKYRDDFTFLLIKVK